MSIVVIGASGFLGQHLLASMEGAGAIGTYHQCALPGLQFIDLRESEQIMAFLTRISPSLILYAAGLTDVDACEKDPVLAWRLNVEAAAEIAAWGRARTVYLSTDYVFDGVRGLYDENDDARPLNTYGRTKLAGEHTVLRHGEGNLVIRVSGLYDARGIKGREFSNPRPVECAQDVRISSPTHVEDVVSAIRLLIDTGCHGVYHVAGPEALSRYEFWQLVGLRYSAIQELTLPDELAARPPNSSLQTRRMEALGWRARRVCDALPALPLERPPLTGRARPPDAKAPRIAALLIDCVGALLTSRTWLPRNGVFETIDRACATATEGTEFWKRVAESLGIGEANLPALHERIAFMYAPNPCVWARLASWRACYRLALVNNGPAATFRCWVRKYGLDHVFDVLANSEEMGLRKPDREFFQEVAEKLGVELDQCILLDDDPRNIEGAALCGLRTVLMVERGCFPLSNHIWQEATPGMELFRGGQ